MAKKINIDTICTAIAESIHYPEHLSHEWLEKYGYIKSRSREAGIRHQLVADFNETYKEMRFNVDAKEEARGPKH